MKHHTILIVFTAMSLLFASMDSGYAQQDFAKLGTTLAADHPALDALTHFRDSLDEQLTIQLFPGAQLGSAQQIMEGLQFGDIELGILPLESLSPHAPFLAMLDLPYLFRDDIHRAHVLDGPLGKQFLEALNELNLVGLAFLETCPRFYLGKDLALHSLENFQDRTVALICPHPENESQIQRYESELQRLKHLGARPFLMFLENLEKSLESENPDVIEYLPFIGMEHRLQDSEFHILTLPAYRTIPTLLVASRRWFETLSSEVREAVARASNTLVRQHRRDMEEALQHEYAALQAQGIEGVKGEEDDLRQAMHAFYKEMAEQFPLGFDQFFQAVQNTK